MGFTGVGGRWHPRRDCVSHALSLTPIAERCSWTRLRTPRWRPKATCSIRSKTGR
jgi:hypothetical protein